jgi:hypothetical protein
MTGRYRNNGGLPTKFDAPPAMAKRYIMELELSL